jgi:hypothetical protein
MDYLFTRKQIQGKIRRLIFWVILMWVIYVGYSFLNSHLNSIREQSDYWQVRPLRFVFREFVVYFFGFMGYVYLRREKLHPNLTLQFWLFLALLDILCLSMGFFREFVMEVKFLHDAYNRIIDIIASPIYTVCFTLYALYFSIDNSTIRENPR